MYLWFKGQDVDRSPDGAGKLHDSAGKDLSESAYEAMAGQVLKICGRYDTPCMLHSFVEVARRLHHPYIHLPLFLLEEYCGKLNDFRIVGSSIHSTEEAVRAQKAGAAM